MPDIGTKKKTTGVAAYLGGRPAAPPEGAPAAPAPGPVPAPTQTTKGAGATQFVGSKAALTGGAAGSSYPSSSLDVASLLKSLAPPPPAATGAAAGPDLTNTAAEDPYLKDYLGRVRGRLDDPEGSTKRATNVAGSALRDLAEGEKSALHASLARRGVLSGSSLPQIGEAAISDRTTANVARVAADIGLQRERDNDAFLAGSGGAFSAIGDRQRQDKALALNQWEAGQAAQRAAEQAGLMQWRGSLDLISSLLRL